MALLLSIRSVLPLPPSMEGVGIKESTFIVLKTRWFSHKLVFEGFSSVEAWGGSMALEEMKKTSSLSKLNENETFPYCILSWVQLHQYHQLGLREEKKWQLVHGYIAPKGKYGMFWQKANTDCIFCCKLLHRKWSVVFIGSKQSLTQCCYHFAEVVASMGNTLRTSTNQEH